MTTTGANLPEPVSFAKKHNSLFACKRCVRYRNGKFLHLLALLLLAFKSQIALQVLGMGSKVGIFSVLD